MVFFVDDDEGIRELLELQAASIGLECESFAKPTDFLEQSSHTGHVHRVELALDADQQRLSGEFVEDVERPLGPSIMVRSSTKS